jgi:polyvinyl alcohol dehydrogenase (cytochrome)
MTLSRRWVMLAVVLFAASAVPPIKAQTATKDWPMYNLDVLGTRCNRGETAIGPQNAGELQEKWRFPARGSSQEIGVIHATPVVVNGYVYFGTATDPTFYKLTPDGKVRWSYRNPVRQKAQARTEASLGADKYKKVRFQSSAEGIMGSALVTDDTVFFGDIGGWFYALDRATGRERWKLNARAEGFPCAHPMNVFFASPLLADGKLIVAAPPSRAIRAVPAAASCLR